MIKIVAINHIQGYTITCTFNNGCIKKLDAEQLINNHLHLKGVSSLLDHNVFKKAKIGMLGEIMWENIVANDNGRSWNYDISPDFVYQNAESII